MGTQFSTPCGMHFEGDLRALGFLASCHRSSVLYDSLMSMPSSGFREPAMLQLPNRRHLAPSQFEDEARPSNSLRLCRLSLLP